MSPEDATKYARQVGLKLAYGAKLGDLETKETPFVQLGLDQAAADYISASKSYRHGRIKTSLHRVLRQFLSDFDVNGLLGTYPMHVLSTPQWRHLLEAASPERLGGRLLDIGSGRGDVTSALAPIFDTVTTTETARSMVRRLRKRGYHCYQGDIVDLVDELLVSEEAPYDAVSLLNVLDRCDRPLSMLAAARRLLKPNGLLAVALVLPYSPFVYDGTITRPPRERLPITSKQFELATTEFIQFALKALAFEIVSISRVPYLSGGDAQKELYELDDLILIARAVGEAPPLLTA
ncbi:MAG: methyltransferase-like protein 9 [Polyangiaceae bacterium]|nr:methyltransferase-like protein 9 [Polyangiaceae bacterium]